MEIVYCSKCGKMVPPGGVDEGKRYLVDGETVCPKCYRKMPSEEHRGNTMVVSENLTLRPAVHEPAEPDFGTKPKTSKLSMPAAKRRASTRKLPALARSSDSARHLAVRSGGHAVLWWVGAAAVVLATAAALALRGSGVVGPRHGSWDRTSPDARDPDPRDPAPGARQAGDERLRAEIEKVQKYWEAHPDDHAEAIRRFQQLRASPAGVAMTRAIDDAIRSVEVDRDLAVQALMDPFLKRAAELEAAGDFDGAAEVYGEPPEKLAAVLGPRFDEQRRGVRERAEAALRSVMAVAERLSGEGKPEEALAELDNAADLRYADSAERLAAVRELIETEQAAARTAAEKLLAEEARRALEALNEGFEQAAMTGDCGRARSFLAEGKGKLGAGQLTAIAAELVPLERLAEGLASEGTRCRAELAKLAGRQIELAVRVGRPVRGRLTEVQDAGLRLEVPHRQGEAEILQPRLVTFAELVPGEVHRLAPRPDPRDDDGRLAVAVHLMRSEFGPPAPGDLDRAGRLLTDAAGHPLAARWSKRLETVRVALREDSAGRAWREGLAALAGEDRGDADRRRFLTRFLDSFVRDHGTSDFARSREAEVARLRDAAGGAEGAVRLLFKGQVLKFEPSTREIELVWDFASAEQLADFAPVKEEDRDKVRIAAGSCAMEHGGGLDCPVVFAPPIRASARWKGRDGDNFGIRLTARGDSVCLYWDGRNTLLWRGNRNAGAVQAKPGAELRVSDRIAEVVAEDRRILGPVNVAWQDARVSLYSVKARVSFEELRVAGVLDRAWLDKALARSLAEQIARAAAVRP